jgi:hypothetical protein
MQRVQLFAVTVGWPIPGSVARANAFNRLIGHEADKHMAHTAVNSNDSSGLSYSLRLETEIELRTASRD